MKKMHKTGLRVVHNTETNQAGIILPRGGRINFPVGKDEDAMACAEDLAQWGSDNASSGFLAGTVATLLICGTFQLGRMAKKKFKEMKKKKESKEKEENEEE